jgi:hypothetical protein
MIRTSAIAVLASCGLLASTPALAQTLGQGADTDIPWLRLGAALILCLGLAAGAAFALNRRLNGGNETAALSRLLERLGRPASAATPPRLTGIETRRLSAQVTVSVFKCDGRDFMVASSLQGRLVLVSLDGEDAGADA